MGDAIGRRNGDRDRIVMMAVDGRCEMKYARCLNLLLSCRKYRMYRARDRGVFFYCPISRLLFRLRRRINGTGRGDGGKRKIGRSNNRCLSAYYPRIARSIASTGESLNTFRLAQQIDSPAHSYENLSEISCVRIARNELSGGMCIHGGILHSVLVSRAGPASNTKIFSNGSGYLRPGIRRLANFSSANTFRHLFRTFVTVFPFLLFLHFGSFCVITRWENCFGQIHYSTDKH